MSQGERPIIGRKGERRRADTLSQAERSIIGRRSYDRLPRGLHGLGSDVVAHDQRERLQAAMVELVVQRGYQATLITDLTRLARVSRVSFYSHFSGKEQCFLATYEDVMERAMAQITTAYRRPNRWDERLRVLLETFVASVLADPMAAHFLLVSALSSGPDVLERRDRLTRSFERRVGHSYDKAPDGIHVPDTVVRAIVGGIANVAYVRLRQDRVDELPGFIDDFVVWGRCYRDPAVMRLPAISSRRGARSGPGRPQSSSQPARRLRSGAHKLSRSFVAHDQRARIMDAVISIIAERGHTGLTIPEICRTAGVSSETFYEQFPDKAQALTASFQGVGEQLFSAVSAAFTPVRTRRPGRWPMAVRAAIEALVTYFASEPAFARVVFIETLLAGSDVADLRERYIEMLVALIVPGGRRAPAEPAPIIREAVAGAVFEILYHEVRHGRAAGLPELIPHLTYIALTPFIGAENAIKVALQPSVTSRQR